MHNQMRTVPDAYRDWIENDSQEIRLHEKSVKWFMAQIEPRLDKLERETI